MDPATESEDCWMKWDPIPDTTCTVSTTRSGRVGGGATPKWKGYVVLTPEEIEEQRLIEEAKAATITAASSTRSCRRRV